MVTTERTTLGVFSVRSNAVQAIHELKQLNLSTDNLSIIMRDEEKAGDIGAETGATVTKATAAGAGTGAVAGGLAGLAIGLSAFVIPGVGPLLLAGPLVAALGITGSAAATGAVTGAATGGLIGVFSGIGISAKESEKYENAVRRGDVLVAIGTDNDNYRSVEEMLERNSAREVKTVGKDFNSNELHATKTPA